MSTYRLSITAAQAVKLRDILKASLATKGFKKKDLPEVLNYVHVRPFSVSGKDAVDFTLSDRYMVARFGMNDAYASWGSGKVEAMLIETKALIKLLSIVKPAHLRTADRLMITWEMGEAESYRITANIANENQAVHAETPLVHKTNYQHGHVVVDNPDDQTWRWPNVDSFLPKSVELGWDLASDEWMMSPEHHIVYGKIVGDDWQRSRLRYSNRMYVANLADDMGGAYYATMAFMGVR